MSEQPEISERSWLDAMLARYDTAKMPASYAAMVKRAQENIAWAKHRRQMERCSENI